MSATRSLSALLLAAALVFAGTSPLAAQDSSADPVPAPEPSEPSDTGGDVTLLDDEPPAPQVGPPGPAASDETVTVDDEVKPADPLTDDADVIVTGGFATEAILLPRSTEVLRAADARVRQAAGNVAESMGEMAGVNIQKTGRFGGSPFIRGFTAYSNLMLIDGVRFNNSAFRSGPNQYWGLLDMHSLNKLELTYGPGSVLYGSDAIGGTINLSTLRWSKEAVGKDGHQTRLYGRYGTADRGAISNFQMIRSMSETSGFAVSLTTSDYGDLIAGDGGKPYTDYSKADMHTRFTWQFDEWTVDAIYQYGYQDNGKRTHRTVFGESFEGTSLQNELAWQFDHDRHFSAVQFRHKPGNGSFYDELWMSFSLTYLAEDRLRIRGNGQVRKSGFQMFTAGAQVRFQKTIDGGHKLSYGVDAYIDRGRSERTTDDVPEIQGDRFGDDAWYQRIGIYAHDDWVLNDQFALVLGARGTFVNLTMDQVADGSGALIQMESNFAGAAGNIGAQFYFMERSHIYVDASLGFRAPTLADLSEFGAVATNETVVPNANVNPEYYLTFELGTKFDVTDTLRGRIAGFYTRIYDLLGREATGNIVNGDTEVQYVNQGEGFVVGFDLEFDWTIVPEFAVFGNFFFGTSWNETRDTHLNKFNPNAGMFGVRYNALLADDVDGKKQQPHVWFEAFVKFAFKQGQLSAGDLGDTSRIPPGGTPGWVTINLRSNYRIAISDEQDITIFLHLYNIADENYRIHGSGDNEPGINFVFGSQFDF